MKHLFTKLYVVGLLLTLPLAAFAQGKVSGKLVDSSSKEPLIGAAIYLESDKGVGTVTSLDGTFELNLESGKQNLVFTYLGYVEQTQTVDVSGDLDLGTIKMKSSTVGLTEVSIVASFATDRKTPVAISNIPAAVISEKLGNQEFPEILKSTPSVYATKQGGGFGDSRISIRGFNTSNIGVLINGVPVNDMENGRVYFSNWAGLSDVTSVMQVQRGLGASKLAISSVGGTINILTKSADAEQGGSFYAGTGNDGYKKLSFNVSTGLMENGWALTLLGGTVKGDGYVDGTDFQGYNYFFNVTKVINDNHRLSLQGFGAPQWHNQRGSQMTIAQFENKDENLFFSNSRKQKFNSDYGIRDGKNYGGSYAYNFYHKPQFSLNHFWDINDYTSLSTSVYASLASGGGRRLRGDKASEVTYSYSTAEFPATADQWRTGSGLIDWDKIIAHNQQTEGAADFLITNSMNEHQWFGMLSTFNTMVNNINITAGLDSRYYLGSHYEKIDDLLGGQFFIDDSNINRDVHTPLREGDKYSYHNDMQVVRNGVFLQAEGEWNNVTAFISGTSSYQNVRRIDFFQYKKGNEKSDWANFLDWSVKGGANYNFSANHNAFINAGYFIRSPFVKFVFDGYTNDIIDDAQYEKVLTFEAGYGYRSKTTNIKLGYYRTEWRDQGLSTTIGDAVYSLLGLNSLHQGIELEAKYRPTRNLTIKAMASVGLWKYTDDVRFQQFDDQGNFLGEFNAYLKDVSVGNSAQTTAALSVNYKFLKDWNIAIDGNYFGRNFADFDPSERTGSKSAGIDSWQMPDAYLFDMNAGYNFKVAGLKTRISGKISNLFDTVYITDATDGSAHDWKTSPVYYGLGRTYSVGLKVNF